MMTCSISALVVSDGYEVWVLEIPAADIPPGCRKIGTLQFLDGKCIAKSSEATMEASIILAASVESFAQLVAARLRERSDYRAWRQRILAMPEVLAN
jgi:hypothetical protein